MTVDSMNNSNSLSLKNGLKYLTDCIFCFEYNQIVNRTRTRSMHSFLFNLSPVYAFLEGAAGTVLWN